MDSKEILKISSSALKAQSQRMKVIAENVANADSLAITPGGDPYRRKTIQFKDEVDRATGAHKVEVAKVGTDPGKFQVRYDPTNPGADASGYVKLPNVNPIVEMADLKEAQRSYEANLQVIDATKSMQSRTLDLIRQ
jgi:flagellar basal-body rod protein FlgC